MDHRPALVIAAILSCCVPAFAGYAEAVPPPGFARTDGLWTYKPANQAQWVGTTVRNTTSLNVGGRAVTVPFALRLAANAPRYAAAALYAHPGLRTALGIATWLGLGSIFWDDVQQVWKKDEPDIDGTKVWMWGPVDSPNKAHYKTEALAACQAIYSSSYTEYGTFYSTPTHTLTSGNQASCVGYQTDSFGNTSSNTRGIVFRSLRCPDGSNTETCPIIEVDPRVLSKQQFEDELAPLTMPQTVPQELPNIPYPVELPVINPSPAAVPVPQPLRVPLGDPIPQGTPSEGQPQQWKQPVVDIVPSPTVSQPWRVDAQPKDIVSTAPVGQPAPNPVTEPVTPPATSEPGKTETPAENPGLCELYPDILACEKVDLGQLDPTSVPSSTRNVMISPDSGWGASGGACPAPRTISVSGGVGLTVSYEPLCMFAEGIRPVVIAVAWLAAALTFFGFARGKD